jgi:hypothetical protein
MADIDVHNGPVSIHNDPTSVEIKGLDNSKSTITLATPQPVRTETKTELVLPQPLKSESKAESKLELVIPQPLRSESKTELDFKPLVVDQCVTINLGRLPPTCIRKPYHQHFGITVFGVEIIGFTVSGETQTIITDLPSPPQVAWGGERNISHSSSSSHNSAQPEPSGGLRIRLG